MAKDEYYEMVENAADRIIRGFVEALAMTGIVAVVAFAGFILGSWS